MSFKKSNVMCIADDEEEKGKQRIKMFYDALGGKVIELRSHGHYVMEDMGTHEFSKLIEEVLEQ